MCKRLTCLCVSLRNSHSLFIASRPSSQIFGLVPSRLHFPLDSLVNTQVTASSKLVVPRKVVLLADRFQTFHDFEKDPANKKTWYLDRRCEVSPKNTSDGMPSQRKIVRPQSTWTITARVKMRGEQVKLVGVWTTYVA